MRGRVLQLVAVSLHHVQNLALAVLCSGWAAQSKQFVVAERHTGDDRLHHGDAARAKPSTRSIAQKEVVLTSETLNYTSQEQYRGVVVSVWWACIGILQEEEDLLKHNGLNQLGDVMDELQSGCYQKRGAQSSRHAKKEAVSMIKADWPPVRSVPFLLHLVVNLFRFIPFAVHEQKDTLHTRDEAGRWTPLHVCFLLVEQDSTRKREAWKGMMPRLRNRPID